MMETMTEPSAIATPPQQVPSSQRYVEWVLAVRGHQDRGRHIAVTTYHEVCRGRDEGIWKDGPYQSFERCIDKEFGVSPQRWANLVEVIQRFGESWIEQYGYEPACTMLRLEPGSPNEQKAFAAIARMTDERGRPPSPEAVKRQVDLLVPPQRPTGARETEEDRLRGVVRDLEMKMRYMRKELGAERARRNTVEKKLDAAESRIAQLSAKLSTKGPAKRKR